MTLEELNEIVHSKIGSHVFGEHVLNDIQQMIIYKHYLHEKKYKEICDMLLLYYDMNDEDPKIKEFIETLESIDLDFMTEEYIFQCENPDESSDFDKFAVFAKILQNFKKGENRHDGIPN